MKRILAFSLPGIAMAALCPVVEAESAGFTRWPIRPGYTAEVLARAPADEYYYGLGSNENTYVSGGIDLGACNVAGGIPKPKVNETYIWSLTHAGRKLYFGTVANGNALAASAYSGLGGMMLPPNESFAFAQEFGLGVYGRTHGLPAGVGDWRPPRILRYDLDTGLLEALSDSFPAADAARLAELEGLRAAGAVPPTARNPRGLVVLAGPRIDAGIGGVGFFFFDGTSGEFLGSILRPEFSNIRRFATLNGDLYAAVQNSGALGDGSVIRIVNTRDNRFYPFGFEVVGELDQGGADIAAHDGRLFVTTWPGFLEGGQVNMQNPISLILRATGLWMSPPVPPWGLTALHRKGWVKVWHVHLYEPDAVMGVTYAGGALASFDGWLYFGTMHGGRTEAAAYQMLYGLPEMAPPAGAQPGSPEFNDWLANRSPGVVYSRAARMSSLFRARSFRRPRSIGGLALEPGGEFELLYGYRTVPVWNETLRGWVTRTNVLNQTPLMGAAGFGYGAKYVWSMAAFRDRLYLGTLGSLLLGHGTLGTEAEYRAALADPTIRCGAALLMLPSSAAGAFLPVSASGLGNPCNFGIRTLEPTDDALYAGTANGYNLFGNPDDDLPDGGWELIRVTAKPPVAFDADGDFIADPAWSLPGGDGLALGSADAVALAWPGVASSRSAWADYDGDGLIDPGWFTPADGVWQAALSTWNGARRTIATTRRAPKNAWPVPADYDGDGEAEPAWAEPVTGVITVWSGMAGQRPQVFTPGLRFAGLPAPADYDGDGRAEPGWYVSRGVWVLGSGAARRTVSVAALNGWPVPADYDGDGRADLALFIPATAEFRVQKYSSGLPPAAIQDGLGEGWLPMPADYDGDGRADFACYHRATWRLSIRFAAGGYDCWLVPEVGTALASPVVANPPAALLTR